MNVPFPSRRVSLKDDCQNCKKEIDTENDLFYSIGKDPPRKEKMKGISRTRVWVYCADCFRVMAGESML